MSDLKIGCDVVAKGLGPFEAIAVLGAGAYGETYRVERGGRCTAIKVIHNPQIGHLWERELEALGRITHENVVALHGSGSFDVAGTTYLYLECELVDGGSGAERISAGMSPSTPAETKAMFRGLLRGVDELHDVGVIHRDIKPANIAFRGPGWASPVILDFGLAKVFDMSSHTDYPALLGTAKYMAPEQLRGTVARRRSDLFSVAVSVFELASGTHPFVDDRIQTPQQLRDRIETTVPPSLDSLGGAVTPTVDRILGRLLSARAHQRLSLDQALRDLESDDADGE